MFFSRAAAGMKFVSRGDPDSWDFTKIDFTLDWAWHELDLSSIVGVGERLVLIRLELRTTPPDRECQFRTRGITGDYNIIKRRTVLDNVVCYCNIWLRPDISGIVEYKFEAETWASIYIAVKGWLE